MPLLASFIGTLAGGLASFFARFVGFGLALKLASYTTWITVFGTFLASVIVCCTSLFNMLSGVGGGGGGGWVSKFFMALGMFIPGNATAVISCIASVWIATSIFKIQRIGIENFSK
jgi:hypothetical protein